MGKPHNGCESKCMKYKILTLFIFIAFSCKKPSDAIISENTIFFTANSTNYKFTGVVDYFSLSGVEFNSYGSDSNKIHIIFSTRGDANLTITVDAGIQLNTKLKMRDSSSFIYFDNDTDPVTTTYYFDTTTSYVVFTKFDNRTIIGTFQCNGTDPHGRNISVTKGKFYLFN
jgi:hypothetical protein